MTHQDIAVLVRGIARLWPTVPYRVDVDADFLRVWAAGLDGVTLTEAEAAVVIIMRGGATFPPGPGEIFKTVTDAREHTDGSRVPDADQAWDEVSYQIRRRGWHNGPPTDWSHLAVGAAVAALGWTELCHGDVMIVRAHFVRMYPAIAARSTRARQIDDALVSLGVPDLFASPPALDSGNPG